MVHYINGQGIARYVSSDCLLAAYLIFPFYPVDDHVPSSFDPSHPLLFLVPQATRAVG